MPMTFDRSVIQHSLIELGNGNMIVKVRDNAENLAAKLEEVLKKIKDPYLVRDVSLTESDGLACISLILEPSLSVGVSNKLFVFRADAALFFQRVEGALKKFKIDDVDKMALSSSMGFMTAVYVYTPHNE